MFVYLRENLKVRERFINQIYRAYEGVSPSEIYNLYHDYKLMKNDSFL